MHHLLVRLEGLLQIRTAKVCLEFPQSMKKNSILHFLAKLSIAVKFCLWHWSQLGNCLSALFYMPRNDQHCIAPKSIVIRRCTTLCKLEKRIASFDYFSHNKISPRSCKATKKVKSMYTSIFWQKCHNKVILFTRDGMACQKTCH